MPNIHKYSEHYRTTYGGFSSALGEETSDKLTTPAFVSAKNYDVIIAQAPYSGIASGSTVTLKMYQATAANGGGSKTVTGASATFTAANTTDTGVLTAQVRGAQLDMASAFVYVGAILSTNDTGGTEKVSLHLIQGRARYPQASLPS